MRGSLIRLDDRLPAKDMPLIAEFIDVGELGLALEQMADVMSEDPLPLAPDERADMRALAERACNLAIGSQRSGGPAREVSSAGS